MLHTTIMSTATSNKARIKGRLEAARTFIVFIIIGGVAFLVSLFFDFSLCPIYNITGLPCFSCGMTRAFRSLPNIRQALWYHPLFFIVLGIPFMAFLKEKPRNIVAIVLLAMLIVLWVIRMIFLFPDTSPFEYNANSLFEVILRLFR